MIADNPTSYYLLPAQFLAHWKTNKVLHRFNLNLWNFEAKAGKRAKKIFRESFERKKFNSDGASKWQPRKRNKVKNAYPLMDDTGSLKNSITWKRLGDTPTGVVVYTDPTAFANTSSHKGFCYAAVHNGPSEYRTGKVSNMPRRQFMGYSTVLEKELAKLTSEIFDGIPR